MKIKYRKALAVTIGFHIPQIVASIKAKKKVRVLADEDKFWNKKVIGSHLLTAGVLLYENTKVKN